MFGTSGIRGPVGDEVTADLALAVGRALGVDADSAVVGRDARDSGRLLVDALTAGLRESGTDVVDLGLAATPTVARSVGWRDADAGVVVTASHNPPEDNGIKLWQPSGQAFDAPRRETVAGRVREGATDLRPWDGLGDRVRETGAAASAERHVHAICEAVDLADPLSVVVDVGNGTGGITVEALQRLGCDVETLNAQPDGSFPGRPSEPTAENCASLATLVRETDADVGIAHDGDADRMRAATAEGEFLAGDVLLALFGRDAASDGGPGTAGSGGAGTATGDEDGTAGSGGDGTAGDGVRVAAPIDTSLAVDDHLAEVGVSVTRTKVGDVYVAERASEADVAFGGEPSGAWIWPAETLCPDGPLAACKLVALASERPLAQRAADVETYPLHRDSVETDEKGAVMDRIADRVTAEYDDVSTLDGVHVDLGDAWFLLRASGTQPLVRVTAEARDADRARAVFDEARDLVTAVVDE